ncbi:sigma-70 family RNA polymerase sigma factor [Radiobacillus sp. PE A8.2]|uniref:sigma-70 family RNA polymerase sigma factor n=1 Tax=Radiobacillus sp. PE A8.2 TaxID=3380349 RepID=UPI00388F3CA8
MKENIDSIYNMYFQNIYRFLLSLCHDHYTAEDLVQETFFRAHLTLEVYEGKSIKTWLFTVAYRAYIDHYRKQKRIVIKDDKFFTGIFDKKKYILDDLVANEEIEEIVRLLDDIPEKHKYAVLLHDFHGLTQQEAAEVMSVKPSHYKVLLFRGRQAIRRRKAGENE